MILRRTKNNFETTKNPKFDMCQNKERDTNEEEEKDNIFLHKNSEQQEEETIMEMLLPYTSH
jgi:hypothetical protein